MSGPDLALLREVPAVDRVVDHAGLLIERFGRKAVTGAIRECADAMREAIRRGDQTTSPTVAAIVAAARAALEATDRRTLVPVHNLTGTVLHTNLGRAVLPTSIVDRVTAVLLAPSTVEFDLESGKRGERDSHLESLVCELTGAEAATFVNNNAAALLLVLNTLAEGRSVPVSRGELVEIGGSFRIPDVMSRAGCQIREVGTTNRTHPRDYSGAIDDSTALLLKVHPSNYKIAGFTKSVADEEVAAIASDAGLPFVNDLGSGTLLDLRQWGLPHETTVREALESGANLVTFSGDKLLGGTQAGFIVGDAALVDAVRRNPMKRALRLDKLAIVVLDEVLRLYRHPEKLAETLPTLRHLTRSAVEIRATAARVAKALQTRMPDAAIDVVESMSQIGSGSLPVDLLKSHSVRLQPLAAGHAPLAELVAQFRQLPRPVIGRVHDGALLFDLRTLDDEAAFLRNLDALA